MNKKSKNALLLVVILAIVGIAVGYAALSQNLVLEGTATVKGSTDWDVHFVKGTETATNGTGATDATITVNDDTLTGTFSATFEPGGEATYTVDVVNDGSIAAVLSGEPEVAISGEHVTCEVAVVSGGDPISENNGKDTYRITLKCEDMDALPADEIETTATVTFKYVQYVPTLDNV